MSSWPARVEARKPVMPATREDRKEAEGAEEIFYKPDQAGATHIMFEEDVQQAAVQVDGGDRSPP